MSNRQHRVRLAEETEQILRTGRYHGPAGEVDLTGSLKRAVSGTVLHAPDDPLPPAEPSDTEPSNTEPSDIKPTDTKPGNTKTTIEVSGESSLAAARRLVDAAAGPVLCLNFASARNPGGGFSTGARGQEESLARASGLMACLRTVPRYYEVHNRLRDPLYTHHVVYSPQVPVFRDDTGALLPEPYPVTILTSAAPNATAMAGEPDRLARIPEAITERIARVLAVAAAYGHDRLVLGAWGCGAFGNDPEVVAGAFAAQLGPGGGFATRFEHVVFAILRSAESANLTAFRRRFASG